MKKLFVNNLPILENLLMWLEDHPSKDMKKIINRNFQFLEKTNFDFSTEFKEVEKKIQFIKLYKEIL